MQGSEGPGNLPFNLLNSVQILLTVTHVSSNHCERARNSRVGPARHHPVHQRRLSDLSALKIWNRSVAMDGDLMVEQPRIKGCSISKLSSEILKLRENFCLRYTTLSLTSRWLSGGHIVGFLKNICSPIYPKSAIYLPTLLGKRTLLSTCESLCLY